MKKVLRRGATLIQCVAFASLVFLRATNADIVFSIDVDPDTPGIQDFRTLAASSTFQATLLLELTGTSTLDSYRTSVMFDNSGFIYQTSNLTPLINYSPQVGAIFLTFDTIGPFEASADIIGQGSVAPLGPFAVGTFSFTAQNSIGSFWIKPIEVALLDGSFDNNFNPLSSVFNGATITITAVPEPSALLTFGVTACSCYLLRRVRYSQELTLNAPKGKS